MRKGKEEGRRSGVGMGGKVRSPSRREETNKNFRYKQKNYKKSCR